MKTITIRLLAAAAVALAANVAFAASEGDMAPSDKASNQLYWEGQAALKKSDWGTALKRFGELEKLLRAKEPQSADAALYWEAYALVQAKRTNEAKTVLDGLRREFPHSRWSKEADALVKQAGPATKAVPTEIGSEELAEAALEGLMSAPPARAIPLLDKVLKGSYSVKLKKRALFVMSQLDDGEGLDRVVEAAKAASDPELRGEAVRILGVSGEDRAIERLREIYAGSKDAREKREVLDAYLVADRKDLVLAAARGEADPDVRAHAIQNLGALDAASELDQLYGATQDLPNRRAIIEALGVAGDSRALAAIAADAKQPEEMRVAAMHALGVAGDEGGSAALRALYASAGTPALRDAVLQGLLVADDSDAVLELYRNAKSIDEKKVLLRTLTSMGDDAAIEAIESELDKAGKP